VPTAEILSSGLAQNAFMSNPGQMQAMRLVGFREESQPDLSVRIFHRKPARASFKPFS
jgi:hypothetical protein